MIPLYQQTLNDLKKEAKSKKGQGIIYSWFSDTFIIYSRNDSKKEFTLVEQIGRLFFQKLILHNIPVRGAITHGSMYSKSSENIFVGPALIDAYNYAEKQDWLGFILTPTVYLRLQGSPLDLGRRAHYRMVTEPGVICHEPSRPIYAFAFNNLTVNGKNPYLSALESMKASAPKEVKEKYERTIAFATVYDRIHDK